MDIMDIIEELLSSHIVVRFGRCAINRKDTSIEVSTREHEFILIIGKSQWTKAPGVFATVGYNDPGHYNYNDADDMERSSGIPTFNIIGHRRLHNIESPDFIDSVEDTLMEFLDDHDEWTTRKMKSAIHRAASRLSDEDC